MSNPESEFAQYGGGTARDKPYKDGELLKRLYVDEKLSTIKIAEKLDCAPNTVRKYLMKNGVEIRSQSESVQYTLGTHPKEVPLQTKQTGAVRWNYAHDGEKRTVFVHRLLAVAMYGFEAVRDSVVHHENEIRWDNRPSNLELMEHGAHSAHHHFKLSKEEYQEIAERYEEEDVSTYDLAPDYGVSPETVARVVRMGGYA